MARKGDETFVELARHFPLPDLSAYTEQQLLDMVSRLASERLAVAVQSGAVMAHLIYERGYTAYSLEDEVGLHRKTIGRWVSPFRERMIEEKQQ